MNNESYILDYLPINSKRRSGKLLETDKPKFVDHDTGNPDSTAKGNVKYFKRTANGSYSASAHVFIDDIDIIICIPCFPGVAEKAWHVLYQTTKDNEIFGDDSNDIAIGSELCYFPKDKKRTLAAYMNYIDFQAYLAYLYDVDPRHRAGHYMLDPTRKTDPLNALSIIDKTYEDMVNDIYTIYLSKNKEKENECADYAIEARDWVMANGISDGARAYDNIKRVELWVMLRRLYDKDNKDCFEGIEDWVRDNKISDGTRPDDNITREETWAILSRYFSKEKIVVNWEEASKKWAVNNKISDGLNPKFLTERQQVWTMLFRCMNL